MVDPERLHRILRRITDDLGMLRQYAEVDPDELIADPVRLGHTKYLFVTMLEGCIDAAQHVCASEGYGPLDTNADAMRRLVSRGILDPKHGATMARAVGFRNVLIHDYIDVDDQRVVGYLSHLADIDAFVSALSRLI